ncbi:MAG TPA: hypothetical protein VGL15_00235 [Vicinamibacteria bacterium]|jgi:hypothetical protein
MQDQTDGPNENLRALWEFLDRSSRQWHKLFVEDEPREETGFELVDSAATTRR